MLIPRFGPQILRYLSQNPQVQHRLREEVLKTLPQPSEREVSFEDMNLDSTPCSSHFRFMLPRHELTFLSSSDLEAVLQESLRVSSTVVAAYRQSEPSFSPDESTRRLPDFELSFTSSSNPATKPVELKDESSQQVITSSASSESTEDRLRADLSSRQTKRELLTVGIRTSTSTSSGQLHSLISPLETESDSLLRCFVVQT